MSTTMGFEAVAPDHAGWEVFSGSMVNAIENFEIAVSLEDAQAAVALERQFEEVIQAGGVSGLWLLSLLASRPQMPGRYLAGHFTEVFAYQHGVLPTGTLVALLGDKEEAVRDEAWQAVHNLYDEPGNLQASAAELDLLAATYAQNA